MGGNFAVAVGNFLLLVVVLDSLSEFVWWTSRFTPRRKLTPAVTAAGMAMFAALAAAFLFYHLAASGGSAVALQGALMVSMAVVRLPLSHLEHNRRIAQEQAAQDGKAVP